MATKSRDAMEVDPLSGQHLRATGELSNSMVAGVDMLWFTSH